MATISKTKTPARSKATSAAAAQCSSREILDRVGDKWSVLAIVNLAGGALRFGELLRRGYGVSQRMLTQTLRGLERDGLVWRKVTPTVPLTVEYGLTPLGVELLGVLQPLFDWSARRVKAIASAQAAYDRRSGPEP